MASVPIGAPHRIARRGKQPYGGGLNVDLYTGPLALHTGNTHLATAMRFTRHGPHQGGQSMLTLHPRCTQMQQSSQTIRPQIPGECMQLVGHGDGQPVKQVFVALGQATATY
jgi:hypothetical protein